MKIDLLEIHGVHRRVEILIILHTWNPDMEVEHAICKLIMCQIKEIRNDTNPNRV